MEVNIEGLCSCFQKEIVVSLASIDSAGVIFFAELFRLAHDVYEMFLFEKGIPISDILNSSVALPIVHSSADFFSPICCGDKIKVNVYLKSISLHSFELEFVFDRFATVRTVHVSIDKDKKEKVGLPLKLREVLESERFM